MRKKLEKVFCMKRVNQASMTVEAAFIVPIIIFTLVAFVHLIFFLFNMIKVESDADRLLFLADKQYDTLYDFQKREGHGVAKKLDGYLDSVRVAGAVYVTKDEIATEVSVETSLSEIPFISLFRLGRIDKIRHLEMVDSPERGRQIIALFATMDVIKEFLKNEEK